MVDHEVARRPKRFPAVGRDDAACLAAGRPCGRRVEHRDAHPRAGAIRTIPVLLIHDRARVLDREFPFFVNRSGGDLIYRANLVMVVEQIVTGSLPSTVVSMVFLVVYLIMMIAYSVPLTMLTLTVCAAVLVISVIFPCATGRWSSVRPSRRLTCNALSSKPSPASKLSKASIWKATATTAGQRVWERSSTTRLGKGGFRHCCQACPRRWCSCCRYAWSPSA